jgi:hypothetical protein
MQLTMKNGCYFIIMVPYPAEIKKAPVSTEAFMYVEKW